MRSFSGLRSGEALEAGSVIRLLTVLTARGRRALRKAGLRLPPIDDSLLSCRQVDWTLGRFRAFVCDRYWPRTPRPYTGRTAGLKRGAASVAPPARRGVAAKRR